MSYRNYKDETLVMLTLAGEQSAYEELVIRYQSAVISSAMSVTHSKFMAEDAAQDAFVSAWMKLDTLNDPSKFAPWVCRIAKNCAVGMLRQYRGFVSLESLENYDHGGDYTLAEGYMRTEDKADVRRSVQRLPERVREIIRLYYFEGLSIVEIADRMRISEGTVKSRLHDGRKRMRKELCAMDEKWNDTLVEKVMKKVAELKLWRLKNNKDGFEIKYSELLRDIEELPESNKKYHALADVLMHGWWWLQGDNSDVMFARIKEAAEQGHNDDVMSFIVIREDNQMSYGDHKALAEFIREKQIPYLEAGGYTKTLAKEWFRLAECYFRMGEYDKGTEANAKARSLLSPTDIHYALTLGAPGVEARLREELKETDKKYYRIGSGAIELRYIDGNLCHWDNNEYCEGYLNSVNQDVHNLFILASRCDSRFFDSKLSLGESIIGSDNSRLTFTANGENVSTPAGEFENCSIWTTVYFDKYKGRSVYNVYYKDGVGIVKYTIANSGITDSRVLSSYTIMGGEGILPLCVGNCWEYISENSSRYMDSEYSVRVIHADADSCMLATSYLLHRHGYNESSWADTMEEIRNEYYRESKNGNQTLQDITAALERAETLAKTPVEKAHTRAAVAVARRIMSTDLKQNPDGKAEGLWNFFRRNVVVKDKGNITSEYNSRWSFEWKGWFEGMEPVLCNHIYGILQDAAKCLWSDEWHIGMDKLVEYTLYGNPMKTEISCTDGGVIRTKAGVFENCMKMSLEIHGEPQGRKYRHGNKEYYFAPGVGIVKVINNDIDGVNKAVYELSEYVGTGEGYMPFCDCLVRKYEAIGLTDGFYAATEYTYVEDENGDIVIFADKTGIRNIPDPITSYKAIYGELLEDILWEKGEREESRLRHDINNLKLLCHMLGRNPKTRGNAERAVEVGYFRLRILDVCKENGELPRGWLGCYQHTCFLMACYLFGTNRKDEGYEYLKLAFKLYDEWMAIPDGELLELGNKHIFGGVKLVKGKEIIVLPDGTKETVGSNCMVTPNASRMHWGMTAPHGWEWFNSARGDELFKEYIAKAKMLMEKENKN